MKKLEYIFEDGNHKWAMVARDPQKPDYLVDTNEYLIINGAEAILADPGGTEIFPAVFSAISAEFNPEQIKWIFSSHQDPDVISSLALWLDFNPEIRCYLSWMWSSFLPHFGGNADIFIKIPDEGMQITLGNLMLEAIPAHYLHSSGNFNLYDGKARILFSGDIGAALLPPEETSLFVQDFARHIRHAKVFHQRWMGSNEAKQNWCERVSQMEIDMLCPQHGAVYQGEDVQRFIHWFAELKVGSGVNG